MKNIICYGDSNTHGYDPSTGLRYPKDRRWTSILQRLLPEGYDVIDEGLNGRTTAFDREGEDVKNGLRHLVPILYSHRPLDIVIFMLGTNDCNTELSIEVSDIKEGMERLIIKTREAALEKQNYLPSIIVVAPPCISYSYRGGPFDGKFNDHSVEKSMSLSREYRELCDKLSCVFADASAIKVSDLDGLHLGPEGHEKLAHLLAETVIGLE